MKLSSTGFEPWLSRWGLTLDGRAIVTGYAGNRLLPVRRGAEAAMLKVSAHEEERRGAALLEWWGGEGAVRVLARGEGATLLERAMGDRSLAAMARGGQDDEASRILCAAADRLHAERPRPRPPELIPLRRWLRALFAAAGQGGVAGEAAATAERLLALDEESCVLHGDLHHENILDGGGRGWLAIDPKGIFGPGATTTPTSSAIRARRPRWRRAGCCASSMWSPRPRASPAGASWNGSWCTRRWPASGATRTASIQAPPWRSRRWPARP